MSTAASSTAPRRAMSLRIIVATWLLLISATVLIDRVALSHLAEQADDDAASAVTDLKQRLAGLTQHVESHLQHHASVPQARYEADHQALIRRLAMIDQALAERLVAEDLRDVDARLAQLEARSAQRKASTVTTRTRPPAPGKPKPVEPPFQVVGAELRAGERFLSILPADTTTLAQVRLLRVGEEEGGWRLEAIDGVTAVLRQAGSDQNHRVSIPTRQGDRR